MLAVPAGQGLQIGLVWPELAPYVPAEHGRHDDWPTTTDVETLYVPAGHAVHVELPTLLKKPEGHAEHVDAPA